MLNNSTVTSFLSSQPYAEGAFMGHEKSISFEFNDMGVAEVSCYAAARDSFALCMANQMSAMDY